MPPLYRFLMYTFPMYLIGLEYILRSAFKVNAEEFMGPTLAGVALGLLIPLVVPKTPGSISPDVVKRVKAQGVT